ncbi:hypothetical protein ERO13_A02G032500v2 [Gossypium hirsutum]|uniref:Uncharacterized protein isoform X1 n=3 Tax=Gossypium TaxID=3633 RepID=A0A1U8MYE5_GOSHI|nr:uncharacterized protein LOC107942668 isoform X1 [Gossypium hirsutum]KAB2092523.1 hypothetical protein ES319_A02G036800v1 [Gossypium barbadense]KAG4210211.1 hypothetical protein ERO13_A02G032500v2 [Gossypium hirsutum]TYH27061.1 hypothetical protein ES288_A02G039500v1 [Gossypium darwinii]TYH27062.1 hypothetical protein ES288_A02G039500v1 [Gossypium darwinii]
MSQMHSKRVYSVRDISQFQYLHETDEYGKEHGAPSSLLQDDHHPSEKGKGRRKRSMLSEEEKRERKRQHDARYRMKKNQENERLKEENIRLKNQLKEKDSETTLDLHEFMQDMDIMQGFPIDLGENQPLTHPQDDFQSQLSFVAQDEVQNQSLVENQSITYFQDHNPQIHIPLSTAVSNDTGNSLEQSQIISQPELVPACCLPFVEKLKREDRNNASYSHHLKTLLQGDTTDFEGYRIPLPLHPIFENIVTIHGDITRSCMLSSFSAENVLLQFLATFKEMEETLTLEQVTADQIGKWRCCIAEALSIKFHVDFAVTRFNEIVKSYMDLEARSRITAIDEKNKALEMQRNALKCEKLEIERFLLFGSKELVGNLGLF